MRKHEVAVKSSRDDDTVGLFVGTLQECVIFKYGYMRALVDMTPYVLQVAANTEEFTMFVSPLVSQGILTVFILEQPEDVIINQLDYDHMDGHPMDFGDS